MIPLYKPYMPELPQMDAILHSGALAYGKWGREFESLLAVDSNVDFPQIVIEKGATKRGIQR